MNNVRFMNSWDLSDVSAPSIVGAYLIHKSRKPLIRLAHSGTLWERRIAVVATLSNQRTGSLSTIRRKGWFVKNVLHNPPSMTPYTSPHRFAYRVSCLLRRFTRFHSFVIVPFDDHHNTGHFHAGRFQLWHAPHKR